MIRRIQDEKQLLPWEGDPLGVRACAAAASYGIDGHVCQFWLQNEDTLLCRIDDSMVLCSGARADWDELAGFLPLSGARVVLRVRPRFQERSLRGEAAGIVSLRVGHIVLAALGGICERNRRHAHGKASH